MIHDSMIHLMLKRLDKSPAMRFSERRLSDERIRTSRSDGIPDAQRAAETAQDLSAGTRRT
jgi:hypothetical protein